MPPRPQGTDGSDHAYRMVIAERYKRMAEYKQGITRLLATHVVMSLVKTAWTSVGLLKGRPIPNYMLGMLLGEVAVIATFAAAKLGNVKESLAVLKAFNIVQAVVCGSHILTAWRYHTGLNLIEKEYSKIAAQYIVDRAPGYSLATMLQVTQGLELFLDLTFGAFLLLAVLVSHNMIKEKMDLKKEAAEKGAAKRAADKNDDDEPPEAVPLEGEAAGSPDKKVTAKASVRARKRIA